MKKWLSIGLIGFTFLLHADTDQKWDQFKKATLVFQKEIPGWCSNEKANKMMNLIYEVRPELCVELGVFGGSSIYPTAQALKFIKKGVVYAIDPWTKEACLSGFEPSDPHYVWWSQLDYEKIYSAFMKMLSYFDIQKQCVVLRMKSINAASQFADNSIDILHIDGNHSEKEVLTDVEHYLPKVKKGGYIWFDDVNWKMQKDGIEYFSTKKAQSYLLTECDLDLINSVDNDCYLFRKKSD